MYREMSVEEAYALVQQRSLHVVDVREAYEAAQGMIAGAMNIPLSDLPARFRELSEDQTHLVVCQNGVRSAMATEMLSQSGYEAVNLTGGLGAWGELA